MAKTSMKERELKREKCVAKYAEKRAAIKAIISNIKSTDDERWEAQMQLQLRRRFEEPPPDSQVVYPPLQKIVGPKSECLAKIAELRERYLSECAAEGFNDRACEAVVPVNAKLC